MHGINMTRGNMCGNPRSLPAQIELSQRQVSGQRLSYPRATKIVHVKLVWKGQ